MSRDKARRFHFDRTKVLYASICIAKRKQTLVSLLFPELREWHWLFSFQGDGVKSTFTALPSSDSRRFCLSAEVACRVPNESFKVRKMLALFFPREYHKGVGSREDKNGLSRCPVSEKDLSCDAVKLRLFYTDRFLNNVARYRLSHEL